MSWFLLALIGPLLYAMTNQIDKILLEKYFKEGGVGTLILVSSLLAAIALPLLFWADPTALSMGIKSIFILSIVGILNVLVLFFYLLALKDEEASVAIVFYQLVPVFGLILGYFILGEVLTKGQLTAMAVVILGTTIISFEIDAENNFKLRKQTVFLMAAASFCWALGSVLFKAVAIEERVWRTLFWEHLMLALIGCLIFVFVGSYRRHFITSLRTNSKAVLSLNFVNESLYMLGNLAFAFAYLMAPISLVLLADAFQPIFVLAIGLFMTWFFPQILAEKIHLRHLGHKVLAMLITGLGTYLLLVTTQG